MPRGKKAGKKAEDRTSEQKKEEQKVEIEEKPAKIVSFEEIKEFILAHKGEEEGVAQVKSLILQSSLEKGLMSQVVELILDVVQQERTLSKWGEKCIQSVLENCMDPKSRIKDAFFFPDPKSEKILIEYLKKAKKSLIVAVFTLTNDDLAQEIRKAKRRGASVRVISDDDLLKMQGSDVKAMYDEGIEVRVDLDPRSQMHHKFCVIDDYILITGSFNWTKQAVNKNQENLVALDDPYLCQLYTAEFDRMWVAFEPSIKKYFGGPIDPSHLAAPPPDEKPKKVWKKKAPVEDPVPEEIIKTTSAEELIQGLQSAAGNLDSIPSLRELIQTSDFSKSTLDNAMATVFELVKANPTFLNWGKQCVQALFSDAFDPKTRIKDAFFFPNPESEKKLIRYLKKAQKTLIVAVFTLTNDDLANEVRKANKRGVNVRIISDDDLMKMQGSDIRNMYQEGIEVRVDLDPRAQMHHKFCVIDGYLLITGSFNWTKQAVNKNQENLVVMDDPQLAELYTKEFDRMWIQFEPSVKMYFSDLRPEIKDSEMNPSPLT